MAITLERIPKAGGASTTKTLKEWGLAPGSMESAAWVVGYLTLTASGESPALSDPVFDYLDTVKVYEDGTCIWWGPVVSTGSTVQPAQQRTYLVPNPMWWVMRTPFVWPYSPEPETLDPELAGTWLGLALAQAAALYPVTWEASDLSAFAVPVPDLRWSANCMELIQRAARLYPLGMQWWDLSGATPKFRCCSRAGGTPYDLARSRCQEPITLEQLHDKRLDGVWIDYVYTNSSGTRSAAMDLGGAGPYTGPNSLRYQVPVGTGSAGDAAANAVAASEAQSYLIASVIQAAYATAPWSGTLTVVGTPTAPLPAIRPGQLLNLTGGATAWATMAAQVQRVSRTIGETCDRMSVELGCGDHLGPTDFQALARSGGVSGGAGGGNPSPYDPLGPQQEREDGPLPGGTFDDLDGSMFSQSPTVSLEWCAAADYLTLPGFSEYNPSDQSGLSVPWKKFLTRTFSGSVRLLRNVGPGVFTYYGYTATLSGAAKYTLGGDYSNTGILTGVGDLNQGSCSWPAGGASSECSDCPNCVDLPAAVTTRTSKVVTGDGTSWSGSYRADLSDEVSEDALIAYWLANTAAYSGWSSTAGVAAYEPRTTSYQFYYSLLKGRGTGSNAVAGWTYTLEIPTEVRTYGSTGAWTAGESVSSEVVADSSGNFSIAEFEVRAPRGYERRPTGTCRVLTGIPSVDAT